MDLESEAMRDLGSIPTGGNIFLLEFLFSCSKDSDANICIIDNFVICEKPDWYSLKVGNTGRERLIRTWLIRSST